MVDVDMRRSLDGGRRPGISENTEPAAGLPPEARRATAAAAARRGRASPPRLALERVALKLVGMRRVALFAAAALVFFTTASASPAAGSLPLREVARAPLPGPSVRFDYTSLDATTGTLWIAHMDANQLLAFDVARRKIVETIPAPGVHGVIAVPQLRRVYASATNDREVLTVDARSGAVLARTAAGEYPDGLAYDPLEQHIFVSDESGGAEIVLSASGHRIATIDLGG